MQKEEELKLDRCMFAVSGTRLLLTFIACEVERRGQGSFPAVDLRGHRKDGASFQGSSFQTWSSSSKSEGPNEMEKG